MPKPKAAEKPPESPPEPADGVPAPDPAPEEAEGGSEAQEAAPEIADADEFKPPAAELVALDSQDVFRAMDRADELQILDELQGRALEVMVYSFSSGGKQLTDLSYAGVREVVRTLNVRGHTRIKISGATPPLVDEVSEDGDSYVRVMIYAEDQSTGSGQWGVATEPKHMKKRNGDVVWDKFALTKALNKAQRNAMKALIPLEMQQTVVAQYLGDNAKVKKIQAGPGAQHLAELPPPLTDPRADAQKQEAREVYDSIKAEDRTALLPAAFHAYLVRAEHSHERLDEFLEYLRQRLAEVTEAAIPESGIGSKS